MRAKKADVDITKLDRSVVAKFFSQMGARKGGLASAAALSPEERKAKGRKAIAARWKKVKRPKGEFPVDQAQVMRRLDGHDSVTLPIAPGAGGDRRLAAIDRLEASGVIVSSVLSKGGKAYQVTIWPASKG